MIAALARAELTRSGGVSTFRLDPDPGRARLIDYCELSAWIGNELKRNRLSPMIRVKIPDQKSFDYCFFDGDFFCLILRETPLEGVRFMAEGFLIFRLILSGEMTQKFAGESRSMAGFSASILSPFDAAHGWAAESADHSGVTAVVVFCRAGVLERKLDYLGETHGAGDFDLHRQADASYSKANIPCTQKMIRLGKGLMAVDFDGQTARLQCEGMALLMIAEFLTSFAQYGHVSGALIQISSRDVQRLNAARDIISREFAEDLTISKLGRRVGLNRKKLTEGFRELFGTTVQGFLVEQRMYAALDLVKEDMPLERIAEQVGYGSSASLVRAFKKFFGSPPRQFVNEGA